MRERNFRETEFPRFAKMWKEEQRRQSEQRYDADPNEENRVKYILLELADIDRPLPLLVAYPDHDNSHKKRPKSFLEGLLSAFFSFLLFIFEAVRAITKEKSGYAQ